MIDGRVYGASTEPIAITFLGRYTWEKRMVKIIFVVSKKNEQKIFSVLDQRMQYDI